jgi:carbamoyl-phosphate synthase small subunit
VKRHILECLVEKGCRLTVFPAETPAEDVLAIDPDGIFLSNGPGDPADLTIEIENIKKMIGKKPIFGICMGHQVMALANGARTKKMLFGHRGINQPVRDLVDHKICITSQNHGFMVDEDSLKGLPVEVINRSLNDNTIEGLRYLKHPTFTVQYHPEASPGPSGNGYLFDRFIKMMGGH